MNINVVKCVFFIFFLSFYMFLSKLLIFIYLFVCFGKVFVDEIKDYFLLHNKCKCINYALLLVHYFIVNLNANIGRYSQSSKEITDKMNLLWSSYCWNWDFHRTIFYCYVLIKYRLIKKDIWIWIFDRKDYKSNYFGLIMSERHIVSQIFCTFVP